LPVVGLLATVEADPDAYPIAVEEGEELLVEQDPVGLHGESDRRPRRNRRADGGQCGADALMAGEQRFATVQDHGDGPEVVAYGVLADPSRHPLQRPRRHRHRLTLPALVNVMIDIAVRTGQVTSTVQLEDDLPYDGRLDNRLGRGRH
jgi:hypothetical protein